MDYDAFVHFMQILSETDLAMRVGRTMETCLQADEFKNQRFE